MPKQRLTDRQLASGVTLTDLVHIVITGDTSQSSAGSSYKATIQQISDVIGGGGGMFTGGTVTGPTIFTSGLSATTISATTYLNLPTFTGNTSGTCINELWVSNISGCSPVTIGTELVVNDDATFDGNIAQTGTTLTFSNGNYLEIGTGFANTGQLTFNANHDGGVATNTYTPVFAGNSDAGMTVIKMPSGGVGGLDFYVKNHGATSGSQNLSGFTKILELNQDGNSTFGGNILLGDGSVSGNYAGFGDDDDLKIFHNGAHSIIRETGTGDLYLQSNQNVILSKDSSTEFMVRGIADGAVELYYDNVKKFETTSNGVDVISGGSLTVSSGNLDVFGQTTLSASGQNVLTVIGSGDTQPLFKVEGSSGELFSITDSLVGELFTVNDISAIPILQVFDDATVHMGSNFAPSLNTTLKSNPGTGLSTLYTLPMSAYTGAWFDYTVTNTGGTEAGTIISVFSGNTAVLTEFGTTEIGDTSDIAFSVSADTTNAYLQVSAATTGWEVKTIIRSI